MRVLGFAVVPQSLRQAQQQQQQRGCGAEVVMGSGFLEGEMQEALAEATVTTISLLGSGVLVFGAAVTLVNVVLSLVNALFQREIFDQQLPFDRRVGGGTATVSRTRLQLNQLLALGLEILVISDLVETLVTSTTAYTYENLGKLALVATIRTLLSFFLGFETKEILDRAKEDKRLDGIIVAPCASDDS